MKLLRDVYRVKLSAGRRVRISKAYKIKVCITTHKRLQDGSASESGKRKAG